MMVAISVTPNPTSTVNRIVRGWMTVEASGNPAPTALNTTTSNFDTPMPPKNPRTVATAATMNDSSRIIDRTWWPLAPTARSSASSRRRWLMMIWNVLLMRNALTNNATIANPSNTHRKIDTIWPIWSDVSLATCRPVMTSVPSGMACWTACST